MATNDKQLEYAKKYQSKTYRLPVYIPREAREPLEAHALAAGYKSLNDYAKALFEADSGINMDIEKAGEQQ